MGLFLFALEHKIFSGLFCVFVCLCVCECIFKKMSSHYHTNYEDAIIIMIQL